MCLLQSHIQQSFQHLRLLRAGDGLLPGHDETGHAVNAQAMRPQIFGMYRIDLTP
jgi:hypothetical protein